ncbi:Uncharacterized protein QTN25_010336 [Entamoeba marina]
MKTFIIFLFFVFIVIATPVHICTDHMQAVEESILNAESKVQDLEASEKETLDDLDSAFNDIRNSICKADFVRTAHVIDVLKGKLLSIRRFKSKWVNVMQNTIRALPPHIATRILFKNKIEGRMSMNPNFISVADVPSVPVYDGMPNNAPVITKIADGVMTELEEITTDQELIELQKKYDKEQHESKVEHLHVQKVLEGIDAILVSVRLGRMSKNDATKSYNKLRTLLSKKLNEENDVIESISNIKKKIFERKQHILEKVMKSGRVIQKGMIKSRLEFLKKMLNKRGKAKTTAYEKRAKMIKKNIVGTSNTLLSYLFGECLVGIIITILKRIYGTPRPYYNTYCIENYKPSCNHSFQVDILLILFKHKIFLTLYLTMLIKPYKMYKFLVVRLLLCIPILISCFVGISRVIDNHHSLTDVLVGSIIGSVISFTTFTTYKNSMITKKEITEEELFSIEFG